MGTMVVPTNAPYVNGPSQGQWTYQTWQTLPDDGRRYEIIDGVLYMQIWDEWTADERYPSQPKISAPSNFHQWIAGRLTRYVSVPVEEQRLGYAFGPVVVLMPSCEPVQPDFVVVLDQHKHIVKRHIEGVPTLIVEILSLGTAIYDENVKLQAYARAGVPEYVIVNPRTRALDHYRLQAPGGYAAPRTFTANDTFAADCLPTIAVPVAALFAGAPDTTL